MATLETGQDPPYEASEHREDMLQHRRDTSQLVGSKHEHRNSQRTVEALERRRGSGLVSELCLPHFSESGI